MAKYITQANDRLFNICEELYGSLTDAGYMSLIIDNPHVWDGQGRLKGGVELTVPEEVVQIPYSAPKDPETIRLRQLMFGGTKPEFAPVGFTTNVSGRSGGEISETLAVEQDVVYRVLSFRGWRSWRPRYGTRMLYALKYNATEELGREAISVASNALTPASDRYTVNSIDYSFREDNRGVTMILQIVVTPSFGQQEPTSQPEVDKWYRNSSEIYQHKDKVYLKHFRN